MTYSPLFFFAQSKGSSRQTSTNYQNASGFTINKSTPVSLNSSGQLVVIDVTSQASVQAMVGLAGIDIPNAATGAVIDNGRLEDVTTSSAVRDILYVSKTGGLTNVKPEIGVGGFVSGDFVVLVGVVIANEFNGSLKDIKLMINVIGRL